MPKTTNDIPTPEVILTEDQKAEIKSSLANPMASMRALTKGKLIFFMKYFWDTYSADTFVPAPHIEYICSELEIVARRVASGEAKEYDLIINVPPGSTKTAMVSIFFPVWCWVNWPWFRFITSSHGKDLSNESAEYSREIIRSEKFQAMFPDIDIKMDKDGKSNYRVVKKEYHSTGRVPRITQGGSRVSTSVDARIMGFHAHIIIPDDIIDPRRAISEVGIQTAEDHMKTLATRKVDKAVTTTILVMQRLHQKDPTGYLMENSPKIKKICLPGEIKNGYKEFVNPKELLKMYSDDGLLDPKRLTWESLKELEAILGQYGYAGQVGQNPTPPGGGMFKVARMALIDHLPSRVNIVRTVRYWDKAATVNAGAFTVGVKISQLENGKYIVEDVVREQISSEDVQKLIKTTAQADILLGDCEIAIEQEPGSGGKESAENTIRNLAGFSVRADKPTGDKVYRADPFSVAVNNGDVILIKGEWNKAFKEELELFPNGTYKDQVDASSAGYNILTGIKEVRIIR